MEANVSLAIVLGQRIVYKGDMANHSGDGAVVAVNAHESSGRMYSMFGSAGSMVPVDSSKSYDIALDDGRMFRQVYAHNIGGSFGDKSYRFMLGEGVADSERVAMLLAGVEIKKASDKAAKDAQVVAFAAAKAEAEAAGLKLGLIPAVAFQKLGKRGSAAAYNLRAELKAAGIKARVKQDGYSSIDVYVPEADLQAAKAICGKYEAGKFDGMDDCYHYAPGAWGSVFGDVQYVFERSL